MKVLQWIMSVAFMVFVAFFTALVTLMHDMMAVWQQLVIILKALFHIFRHTHPTTMITALLLLLSKFWFKSTQCVTFYIMTSNITITAV